MQPQLRPLASPMSEARSRRASNCYFGRVSVDYQVASHHRRVDIALVEVAAWLRWRRELHGLHIPGGRFFRASPQLMVRWHRGR